MQNFNQISHVQAKKMMETTKCKIIDVRTKEEYEEMHIDGAILVPLDVVDREIEKVAQKDEILLVYCRSGVRSKQASQIMARKGYKNIYEFGGIINWSFDVVM